MCLTYNIALIWLLYTKKIFKIQSRQKLKRVLLLPSSNWPFLGQEIPFDTRQPRFFTQYIVRTVNEVLGGLIEPHLWSKLYIEKFIRFTT